MSELKAYSRGEHLYIGHRLISRIYKRTKSQLLRQIIKPMHVLMKGTISKR